MAQFLQHRIIMNASPQSEQPMTPVNSSETPLKPHLAYLDGLRALTAIYVVLFHALIQVEPNGKLLVGNEKAFATIFTFGHQAVDLFIVISGFCLMLPVIKNNGRLVGGVGNFFWKRARRILPPYYMALTLTLLAIYFFVGQKTGTGWDSALPVTYKGLLAHIFLIQDIFADTSEQINGAFWSISVEWRIYFVFPLLLIAWRTIGPILTAILAIVASFIILYFLIHSPIHYDANTTVGIMPQYLALFVLGMLGATICHSTNANFSRLRQRIPWLFLMYGSLALVILLCKMKIFYGSRVPVAYNDVFAGIWAMSLLVTISISEKNCFRKFLAWRPISFVGTFAYSIYLIHGPIQQFLWQYILRTLHLQLFSVFIVQCTVGTIIIIGISYCFFLIGERPFLKSKTVK